MSIYNTLNSDRSLISLPADERLRKVRAKAWTPKSGDQTWVWNGNLVSRLGSTQAIPLIATLDALSDGLAPFPEGSPEGSRILVSIARNAMRTAPGVNAADKETLPMLLLIADKIPSLATALNTIIGYGWNYSAELANATLEQVASEAQAVQDAIDRETRTAAAEVRIDKLNAFYHTARANLLTAATSDTTITDEELHTLLTEKLT